MPWGDDPIEDEQGSGCADPLVSEEMATSFFHRGQRRVISGEAEVTDRRVEAAEHRSNGPGWAEVVQIWLTMISCQHHLVPLGQIALS